MAENSKDVIRTPARLRPGDTIGIIAPAGSFDRKQFESGLGVLKNMGFQLNVPGNLLDPKGYLAGSDAHRADLVNKLFADKTIQAIVCARGGFGSMRILPLLDFELIRRHPKIFVGFSDISAILSALYTRCCMIAFHGPVVTSLADASHKTKDALLTAVSSSRPVEFQPNNGLTIRPGTAKGSVCGGNLTTLCHLVGTPFMPSFAGRILFLEDCGEQTYRIDRMLFQMKLSGCFENLAGLVLGSFTDCGSMESIVKIIGNVFDDDDLPILAGLDAGHGSHNFAFPIGLEATLDADRQVLKYHRAATI